MVVLKSADSINFVLRRYSWVSDISATRMSSLDGWSDYLFDYTHRAAPVQKTDSDGRSA